MRREQPIRHQTHFL